MKNEKLRADIKRELNWPTSTKKLVELLTRCYVALGELDTSMLPAEAQAGLTLQRNEIDRLKQQLRAEGDRIAELNAKLGEQQSVPDAVRDALARRCLWLAFVWNDHNFQSAHIEARKEAEKHGITSFDDANEWLSAPSPVQKPAQQSVPEGWQSIVLLECESEDAKRPSTPTWNGEGLPPVGIKCEFYLGGDEWCRAFTVGIDDDGCMVVQTKNDGYKCSLSPLHFRPISASSERG